MVNNGDPAWVASVPCGCISHTRCLARVLATQVDPIYPQCGQCDTSIACQEFPGAINARFITPENLGQDINNCALCPLAPVTRIPSPRSRPDAQLLAERNAFLCAAAARTGAPNPAVIRRSAMLRISVEAMLRGNYQAIRLPQQENTQVYEYIRRNIILIGPGRVLRIGERDVTCVVCQENLCTTPLDSPLSWGLTTCGHRMHIPCLTELISSRVIRGALCAVLCPECRHDLSCLYTAPPIPVFDSDWVMAATCQCSLHSSCLHDCLSGQSNDVYPQCGACRTPITCTNEFGALDINLTAAPVGRDNTPVELCPLCLCGLNDGGGNSSVLTSPPLLITHIHVDECPGTTLKLFLDDDEHTIHTYLPRVPSFVDRLSIHVVPRGALFHGIICALCNEETYQDAPNSFSPAPQVWVRSEALGDPCVCCFHRACLTRASAGQHHMTRTLTLQGARDEIPCFGCQYLREHRLCQIPRCVSIRQPSSPDAITIPRDLSTALDHSLRASTGAPLRRPWPG